MTTSKKLFKQGLRLGRKGVSATRGSYTRYQQQRRAKNLQKARTVKALLSSNLPTEVKQREIARLSTPFAQTSVKSKFFKTQRVGQDIRQQTRRISKAKLFSLLRRERGANRASFGTEAEQ